MNFRDALRILISLYLVCFVIGKKDDSKFKVEIETLVPGSDCTKKAESGVMMKCHYVGKLTDGKVFENR